MKVSTIDEALNRIRQLEAEVAELKAENQRLRSRGSGGRKKHDATWTASFQDFTSKYEDGMSIDEIVQTGSISRRTAYRYLAYYRELKDNP